MTPSAAHVLSSAKALSREERAELTQELLGTLGEHDLPSQTRLHALREAVDVGVASLDSGEGVHVAAGEIRAYVAQRGAVATDTSSASST